MARVPDKQCVAILWYAPFLLIASYSFIVGVAGMITLCDIGKAEKPSNLLRTLETLQKQNVYCWFNKQSIRVKDKGLNPKERRHTPSRNITKSFKNENRGPSLSPMCSISAEK